MSTNIVIPQDRWKMEKGFAFLIFRRAIKFQMSKDYVSPEFVVDCFHSEDNNYSTFYKN